MRTRPLRSFFPLLVALCAAATPSRAWDGAGHRMITRVALGGLDPSLPAWLRDEKTVLASADFSQVPDRWRGVRVGTPTHANNPDHYLDIEDLEPLGLTLRTLPPFRHDLAKHIALARSKPDFAGQPVNPAKDIHKTDEYPGFLPIATLETYGKLVSAFKSVRSFEAMARDGDTSRAPQIEAATWNARYQIGILSHYVGDAAQPLHTTKHFNGWVGDNPQGYTTEKTFHAYIDGGILRHHAIADADVVAKADFARAIERGGEWDSTLDAIERSHTKMETLYQLQQSGQLQQQEGKELIQTQLGDAAAQLSALIESAWREAAPTPEELQNLRKFEGDKGPGAAQNPPKASPPATPPSQ